MKPSHYITPRTMEDATFHSWGQAIHGPTGHHDDSGPFAPLLVAVLLVGGCMVAAWVLTGGAA